MPPAATVIIATYNKPAYLAKVLEAYQHQETADFEIVVADDGSDPRTAEVVERFAAEGTIPISHIWHEDRGFRKCRILNQAARSARADRLIFTDDDVLPFPDFVGSHLRYALPDRFVSAGAMRLPQSTSDAILRAAEIPEGLFTFAWLCEQGLPNRWKYRRFFLSHAFRTCLDRWLPAKRTLNGGNTSMARKAFVAVNGFNETMGYGSEDNELGVRLINNGIRPTMARHRIRSLHLEHERHYVDPSVEASNRRLVKEALAAKKIVTEEGIEDRSSGTDGPPAKSDPDAI